MIKDPTEPFNPKDKLPLPPDFGNPPSPTVIPFHTSTTQPQTPVEIQLGQFGKRPLPPIDPGAKVIEYKLSAEEIMALRVYLDDKTTGLLYGDIKGPPIPPDEDTPVNMLKGLINDIERGKIHPVSMFIGTIEYKGGEEDYPFYVTGLSRLALRGLLHEYLENLP